MKIAALAGGVAALTSAGGGKNQIRSRGPIGPYLENLVALRGSGERVIIDGPCLCTAPWCWA